MLKVKNVFKLGTNTTRHSYLKNYSISFSQWNDVHAPAWQNLIDNLESTGEEVGC